MEAEELFHRSFLGQYPEENILAICTECVRVHHEAMEFSEQLWHDAHLWGCIQDYPRGLRGREDV